MRESSTGGRQTGDKARVSGQLQVSDVKMLLATWQRRDVEERKEVKMSD